MPARTPPPRFQLPPSLVPGSPCNASVSYPPLRVRDLLIAYTGTGSTAVLLNTVDVLSLVVSPGSSGGHTWEAYRKGFVCLYGAYNYSSLQTDVTC